MNWAFKLGEWLEKRKQNSLSMRLERLEEAKSTDPDKLSLALGAIDRDLKIINMRLDKVELYTGLKREQKAEHVPGAAKIQ